MKEQVFILLGLDEDDPEKMVAAVVNNHPAAVKAVNRMPMRNLVITQRDVYGSTEEIEQDLD